MILFFMRKYYARFKKTGIFKIRGNQLPKNVLRIGFVFAQVLTTVFFGSFDDILQSMWANFSEKLLSPFPVAMFLSIPGLFSFPLFQQNCCNRQPKV